MLNLERSGNSMSLKPIPYQCIWCRKDQAEVTFDSKSHVLPKCLGNLRQQVLPPGVVCDGCNSSFKKLENQLIEEPILKTLVGILQVRDKDLHFIYGHSPSGVDRYANINAEVSTNINRINVTTQYEISGQPDTSKEVRTISESKNYNKRTLAFLSRAVHKIAFETIAHNLYVGAGVQSQIPGIQGLDIFDHSFDAIRKWVRYGEPQNSVRPMLRILRLDKVNTQSQLFQWRGKLHYFQQCFYCYLSLFNDWYILNLTASPDRVRDCLYNWSKKHETNKHPLMLGDSIEPV